MNRPGDEETLRALIKKIREKVPGIILRTTLITGFPTETVEQFDRLADFVRDMEFDRLGCFPYSAEEGTKAAKMDGQLDEETKQHRADIIMEQQMMIMGAKISFSVTLLSKRWLRAMTVTASAISAEALPMLPRSTARYSSTPRRESLFPECSFTYISMKLWTTT